MRFHTPGECGSICCSGFLKVEHCWNLPQPNLSNPIHPMLLERHFVPNSDIVYRTLGPALRLASRFIDNTLPYWYMQITSAVRNLGPNAIGEAQYEYVRYRTQLTDGEQRSTREYMREMAGHVTFEFHNDGDTESSYTTPRYDRKADPRLFNGYPSVISLKCSLYRNLLLHPTDIIYQARIIFALANEICHELAHAVLNISLPDANVVEHYFFPGCSISEDGMSWEGSTYGGIILDPVHSSYSFKAPFYRIDGRPSAHTNMTAMVSWPCSLFERAYRDGGHLFETRGPNLSEVYPVRNVSIQWFVYILRDNFWDSLVPRVGRSALRPEMLPSAYFFKGVDLVPLSTPFVGAPRLRANLTINRDGLIVGDQQPTVYRPHTRFAWPDHEEIMAAFHEMPAGCRRRELVDRFIRMFDFRVQDIPAFVTMLNVNYFGLGI